MLTISPDNRLTITFYKFYCQPIILWFCSPISHIPPALLTFQEKPPLNIRHTTGILISFNNYCSIRIPVYLILHGRGSFFPQPWRVPTTAVGRSCHGRGKLMIPVLYRENALYSFLNLLYIYLTPILSFHLINKIFIFHLQYYLSTFTWL